MKSYMTNLLLFVLSLFLVLSYVTNIYLYTHNSVTVYKGMESDDENVLRKHVMFFDRNNDGVIYPWETFQGFRAIGSGIVLSSVAAVFINVGLSGKTRPGKSFPDLLFPIEIQNINMAKHGSDSGIYDSNGRFVPSKFEEIFHKYAHTNPDALTANELDEFIKGNREPKDYGGWIAGLSEWKILYYLTKDKNGLLKKDTVRCVYDGSLFEQMAAKTLMCPRKMINREAGCETLKALA